MMDTTTREIDALNALLRGELAAVETYQQALEQLADDPATTELGCIVLEHREAASALRLHIEMQGGQPEQSSGMWGAFAKLLEGTASMFGPVAALQALKEGELRGAEQYADALETNLPTECLRLIDTLLHRTRAHVASLDRLIEA